LGEENKYQKTSYLAGGEEEAGESGNIMKRKRNIVCRSGN